MSSTTSFTEQRQKSTSVIRQKVIHGIMKRFVDYTPFYSQSALRCDKAMTINEKLKLNGQRLKHVWLEKELYFVGIVFM